MGQIMPAPKYELTEPGFDCAGGISGVLRKHPDQRKLALEEVTFIVIGGCVSDPDFNHELLHAIPGERLRP